MINSLVISRYYAMRTRMLRGMAAAVLGLMSWHANADTVVLTAVADTTLIENNAGNQANSLGELIYIGNTPRTGFTQLRGLVRFDLAAIPAGAQVTAATLTMTLKRVQSGVSQVSLHKVTESWGEGSSLCNTPCGRGTTAQPGDATWLHRVYPGSNWTTPGGSFIPSSSATTAVSPSIDMAFNWSGALLTADIQSWVGSATTNAGWIILDDVPDHAKAFASLQYPVAAERPQLSITYTTPPPAAGDVPLPAWALVALAAGLMGAAIRRSRRG
jgi:hypothetical protein